MLLDRNNGCHVELDMPRKLTSMLQQQNNSQFSSVEISNMPIYFLLFFLYIFNKLNVNKKIKFKFNRNLKIVE